MTVRALILFLFSSFFAGSVFGQACSTLGQTPSSAFPVCGTTNFVQATVPICGSKLVPVPGCGGTNAAYMDTNPYWYKFTCYRAGTLDFLITPNNLGDDYDWQLFDVTNHDPNDVFTVPGLFVSGNWSGSYGLTGAADSVTSNIQCASNPLSNVPTFSHSPTLIAGHNYLLIVSHFTQTQSGYTLSFGGGTASITDTLQPKILSASLGCDHRSLSVRLNKSMTCASLTNIGSEFSIGAAGFSIGSVAGFGCKSGFDMDSLLLVFNQSIPVGTYSLVAQNGTDGNTLLDNCGLSVAVGSSVSFFATDSISAQFSYQVLLGCKTDTIQVSNPGGHGINSWSWDLDDGITKSTANAEGTYTQFGNKQLELIVSDGFCNDTATALVALNNELKAAFEASAYVCPADKATFNDLSSGNIIQWIWNLGDGTTDYKITPADHQYPNNPLADKTYDVTLIVRDSLGCQDTARQAIVDLHSCAIAVPNAFTPNGDGVNDYLYPLNAYKAKNLEFRVYNRYGQLVFETQDWTRRWDGTIGGQPQDAGTFVWTLQYTDGDTGRHFALKGTTVLIR